MRKTVSAFFMALVFFIATAVPALADFKTGFGKADFDPVTDMGISAPKKGGDTFQVVIALADFKVGFDPLKDTGIAAPMKAGDTLQVAKKKKGKKWRKKKKE